MDYYKVLGVTESADEEQIKQSYRRLAKKYHPDLNPNNPEAEARFKDIVEAYEILGNADKRKGYDAKKKKIRGCGNGNTENKKYTTAQDINIANFTKDMEKYFGFSFRAGQANKQKSGGDRQNPLDVSEMFEAFMKVK